MLIVSLIHKFLRNVFDWSLRPRILLDIWVTGSGPRCWKSDKSNQILACGFLGDATLCQPDFHRPGLRVTARASRCFEIEFRFHMFEYHLVFGGFSEEYQFDHLNKTISWNLFCLWLRDARAYSSIPSRKGRPVLVNPIGPYDLRLRELEE
jgi:hypothetical protein